MNLTDALDALQWPAMLVTLLAAWLVAGGAGTRVCADRAAGGLVHAERARRAQERACDLSRGVIPLKTSLRVSERLIFA